MWKNWQDIIKPKKKYSLENFKYLYQVLVRHPVIDESNQVLIVETLRSIAELLIWGDQNETKFFDFFFEKNIHSYFLRILQQKTNATITVQVLQTLSILFENIQTETSIYYLLSNNYVNQLICHKYDFSDEEVLAYYVSFLKTLSLKLNANTIHFFFNEHLSDFPLYTEAIKFFNHEESMIRIAVRTLTLNVYRVRNQRMLDFILDRTAVPYFSNLVFFIGNQSVSLNELVVLADGKRISGKLDHLVAEHIDNLYYVNDIFCLMVDPINEVLLAQVMKKLLVHLYLKSLLPPQQSDSPFEPARLSPPVALFLLAQVFQIFRYGPLVNCLAAVMLGPNMAPSKLLDKQFASESSEKSIDTTSVINQLRATAQTNLETIDDTGTIRRRAPRSKILPPQPDRSTSDSAMSSSSSTSSLSKDIDGQNHRIDGESEPNPYRTAIFDYLNSSESDVFCLPAICLLYAILKNDAVSSELLEIMDICPRRFLKARILLDELTSTDDDKTKAWTRKTDELAPNGGEGAGGESVAIHAAKLEEAAGPPAKEEAQQADIVSKDESAAAATTAAATAATSVTPVQTSPVVDLLLSKVLVNVIKCRPVTTSICTNLLLELVYQTSDGATAGPCLIEKQFSHLESAERSTKQNLKTFTAQPSDVFLDMFEDELRMKQKLDWNRLIMETSILFPPSQTPLTGLDFTRRLPCGDAERARKAVWDFLIVRRLKFTLRRQEDEQLALLQPPIPIQINDVLDLSNNDMIRCQVIDRNELYLTRYFVSDEWRLILVEPDPQKSNWGIVRYVVPMQYVQVSQSPTDPLSLSIIVTLPPQPPAMKQNIWSSKFIFEDHVRCVTAMKQIEQVRNKLPEIKLGKLRDMLE